MKTINLAPQFEDHERYVANRNINEMISESFKNSLLNLKASDFESIVVEPLIKVISTIDSRFFVTPLTTIPCGDLEYGTTNLRESGCAVFCFQQGLTIHGIFSELDELSEEIAEKGYYHVPSNSTWHCLFDHYGLRRATHYLEIVDALCRDSICTVLVKNSVYHNNPDRDGNHFVNLVGIDETTICVDDPHIGRRFMDFESLLKSVLITWIW